MYKHRKRVVEVTKLTNHSEMSCWRLNSPTCSGASYCSGSDSGLKRCRCTAVSLQHPYVSQDTRSTVSMVAPNCTWVNTPRGGGRGVVFWLKYVTDILLRPLVGRSRRTHHKATGWASEGAVTQKNRNPTQHNNPTTHWQVLSTPKYSGWCSF